MRRAGAGEDARALTRGRRETMPKTMRNPTWCRRLLAFALLAAAPVASEGEPPRLASYGERWLASVEHLMSDGEHRAFDALASDPRREAFIRGFWEARRPRDGKDGAHPALERWHERFEGARERFESLRGDRARAWLVAGKPARIRVVPGCRDLVRFLEIWAYEPWHVAHHGGDEPDDDLYLLFYRESNLGRSYRQWSPSDGTEPLFYGGRGIEAWDAEKLVDYVVANGCLERRGDDRELAAALVRAVSADELRRRYAAPPPGDGWLAAWAAAAGTGLPPARLELRFPGRYQQKTILHGRAVVPLAEIGRNAGGQLFDRLAIVGELWAGQGPRPGRPDDAFEFVHYVAGSPPASGTVALEFYRRLWPGPYTLDVRVADGRGLALVRETQRLSVPELEREAEPPPGRLHGFAGLTRSQVGLLTTFPSLELLLPPGGEPAAGEVEVEALTAGGPIARVDFYLDGALAASDAEPPYAATLALEREPRPHALAAVAVDAAGAELARDEVAWEGAPRRFAVRLLEPVRGRPAVRARAQVDVPEGERLEHLELYWNDRLLATLREPPFVHPLPAAPAGNGGAFFLRAVAVLASGARSEAVAVVSRHPIEEIDVRLVELYTTVLDRQGRPVTGLAAEELLVYEDGVEQPLRRFDTVENLTVAVALLMDVSGSMRGRVATAARSARRFFETVLTPRDLASFLTFNHDLRRVVPFTHDVARLRHGAVGFRAYGTTRLRDGLVYALHSFAGLEGRRALVVLSDGHDVGSDFSFEGVLETARRSGVVVYPIFLGDDEETRAHLAELAAETGGSAFTLGGVWELDAVYRRIEHELRSQYLLVYAAPPGDGRGGFRRIEVEVARRGLRARTLRGYYP